MRFSSLRRFAGAAVFSAAAAFIPLGAAQAADPAHVMTVMGEGEVRGTPDQATLSAGVTTDAATAAAALAANARKMTAVFDTLKRLGVPDRAIQTSNFSVSPQMSPYEQNATQPQRIIGYRVSNQVNVTLDDTKQLGPALDALVAAGANQINSVDFSIRNTGALLVQAREAAVADARARAQTYAKAAGVTLGPVISLAENGGNSRPQPLAGRMMLATEDVGTPTAAGEQSVTVGVTMTFEIK